MSDKKQRTWHMYLGGEYIGPLEPIESGWDSLWISDRSKQRDKWRQALVVGRTVSEAQAIWKRVKANYPNYKYTQFLSRNPCGIDGINADNTTLYMLPGYAENPIVKDSHFQWLIKLAAEVIYVEEGADDCTYTLNV
ncbi:hypothetical protein MOB65_19240 [Bacillus inaquosorum]|uniref:hypothetical protein n=1 Tax=Bacillus inaquosorum TaxID=483913 RepID=UPI00227F8CC9|nr:hypothetical protein [Bacillus inaquosorum]MCY7910999.1 hypothetical protein [Bacillus inaquosorum]